LDLGLIADERLCKDAGRIWWAGFWFDRGDVATIMPSGTRDYDKNPDGLVLAKFLHLTNGLDIYKLIWTNKPMIS